jgi:hypothetical protein
VNAGAGLHTASKSVKNEDLTPFVFFIILTMTRSDSAAIYVVCIALNRACPVKFRKADPIEDRIPPGNP